MFLKYEIQHLCQSYILVQMNKKRGVKLFICDENEEPGKDAKSYRYIFGDLSADQIAESKQDPMVEHILTDSCPFQMVKDPSSDKDLYKVIFDHAYDLSGHHFETENKDLENRLFAVAGVNEDTESFQVMIDSKLWEHAGLYLYIGVFQNDDFKQDRAVTVNVNEYAIEDLLEKELCGRYRLYNSIYDEIKQKPYDLAVVDRVNVEVENGTGQEFTYGECEYLHLIPLLRFIKPKAGEVIYDLGCGTAKPLAIAALEFPDLKMCTGIELLPQLFDLGKKTLDDL